MGAVSKSLNSFITIDTLVIRNENNRFDAI